MSQPLASLSAALVGRRRAKRNRPLIFVPPTPAVTEPEQKKTGPHFAPVLAADTQDDTARADTPHVAPQPAKPKAAVKTRAVKTLRIDFALNRDLLAAAKARGCSQQTIMETALRQALSD